MSLPHAVPAPPWSRSRGRRLLGPGLTAAGVGLAALALRLRDPHQPGSWGFCPFRLLTGLDCPLCGGLRAVNDLTHGDIVAAASSNLLFVVSIPLLVLIWTRWVGRAWDGAPAAAGPSRREVFYGNVALAVTGVFWVVRNLPVASWLAS